MSSIGLDAAFYPHLIDLVLEEYIEADYDASHLRLVSVDWRERVDRLLARFVEIQELQGFVMPDESTQYAWLIRACRRPALDLALTPLRITHMDSENKEILALVNPFSYMTPRHMPRSIRIINLAVPKFDWRIAGRILGSLPHLHTVILHAPNLDFAGSLAHVDRIIYSFAPMFDPDMDEYFDALPCRPVAGAAGAAGAADAADAQSAATGAAGDRRPRCARRHTRKLVVNQGKPDFESPVKTVFTGPLREIVIIMHPWAEAVDAQRARDFDPRQCVVSVAVRGLHIGAAITIVNPAQRDLTDNGATSSFPADTDGSPGAMGPDEAERRLRDLIASHAAFVPAPAPVPPAAGSSYSIERQLRIIETDEYVAEIGRQEFEIEACLRCPPVMPVVMGPEFYP